MGEEAGPTDEQARAKAPSPGAPDGGASAALATDQPVGGGVIPDDARARPVEGAPIRTSTVHAPVAGWTREPAGPLTLSIDVGGTGIKASVLDAADRMVADRVRVATAYPMSPDDFVERVGELVQPLPRFDRVSVGFPGVVRRGVILTAPHFVTAKGPGSAVVADLLAAWSGFPAAERLSARLGKPTRLANDADLQGLAVVKGKGLELVVTFGTGVGTALFLDGVLAPHLELAHQPFRKGETYNEQLGEATLERIGLKKWRKRVLRALYNFNRLVNFDRCYVGGGNSRRLVGHLGEPYEIVDNVAGILGGIRLWERHGGL